MHILEPEHFTYLNTHYSLSVQMTEVLLFQDISIYSIILTNCNLLLSNGCLIYLGLGWNIVACIAQYNHC